SESLRPRLLGNNSYRAAFRCFSDEAISVGVCALDRNEDAPRHHAARIVGDSRTSRVNARLKPTSSSLRFQLVRYLTNRYHFEFPRRFELVPSLELNHAQIARLNGRTCDGPLVH